MRIAGLAAANDRDDAGVLSPLVLAHCAPFTLGPLAVEPGLRSVAAGDLRRTIEPRVMQVLVALAREPGRLLSRDDLIALCWDGRVVGDDAINRVISRLRALFRELAAGAIEVETVPRVGYRLLIASGRGVSPAPLAEPARTARPPLPRRALIAMAALALVAVAALAGWLWRSTAEKPSVAMAVLPFRALDAESEHLAGGISDEVLSELSRQPRLRVAGRTSSGVFAGGKSDARAIGRALDVDYLLEGSVAASGQQLRINVALVNAATGLQVWSRRFAEPRGNILAVQDKIARELSGQLGFHFAAAAGGDHRTTSAETYSLYLMARDMLHSREPEKVQTARQILERVVRMDPGYAPGWSAHAAAMGIAAQPSLSLGAPVDWKSQQKVALAAVDRAIGLAPDLAEAHATRGMLLGFRREALPSLERAVKLDPRDTQIRYWYASALDQDMRFAAAAANLLQVARADPFWRNSFAAANALSELGRGEEALALERRVAASHPDAAARAAAQARIAARAGDWSGFAGHQMEAIRQTNDSSRLIRETQLQLMLNRLGSKAVVVGREAPTEAIDRGIQQGDLPALATLGDVGEWSMMRVDAVPWVLLRTGRMADLLGLWDKGYRRMVDFESDAEAQYGLINFSPEFALALRQGGRTGEAQALLETSARIVARARREGPLPSWFELNAARIEAVRGNRAAALAALRRARDLGATRQWSDADLGVVRWPDQDPLLAPLASDPQVAAWFRQMAADRARELRETEALLGSAKVAWLLARPLAA
jgi:TolB-like protein/DNA-binding winged helix-turn-helix (wHTH) protein/tetratricopeptide (TPR) repeat protein